MAGDDRRPAADLDVSKPNVARVYDAFLGGKDNFAADREFVDRVMRQAPKAPLAAKANRAFLRRVVRYLVADAALTQLLDIGSGLPTQGNVSEVAHDINAAVQVVHVDIERVPDRAGGGLIARRRLLSDPAEALCDSCEDDLQIGGLGSICRPAHRGVVLSQFGVAS